MSEDAIPAATLVIVRDDREGPPQYLMVERAEGMAFAAGALVFPGGRVDAADQALGERAAIDPAMVTAIRETLEETAIPVGIAPVPGQTDAAAIQAELVAGRDFAEILAERRLALVPDALIPFARWVPKFHAVRRFDTLFYVARAPDGDWVPKVIEGECAGARWIDAQAVLDLELAEEARLIFPTRRNLERLAQHGDFAAICDDALSHPIEPVTPWLEERDGVTYLTIPSHLGYPVTAEALEGQWRG